MVPEKIAAFKFLPHTDSRLKEACCGLPTAAETALNVPLTENNISRWIVAGLRQGVLRLKPHAKFPSAMMADSHNAQGQYFRRQPPSWIRRDQERVKLRKQQPVILDQAGGNNFDFPSFGFFFLFFSPSNTA